jgi:aromatic ring-cleaving dioxygenase
MKFSGMIALLLSLPLECTGHADPRGVTTQVECTGNNQTAPKPPIQSYHIHVMFWPNATQGPGAHSADNAMRLRQDFFDHFGLDDNDECKAMFGMDDMCWFPVDWEPGVGLAAPFVVPNWPIYVPMDRFAEAMPWISQHRGDLDVLMHPNSGCMRDDHEYNAMWSGNKWEINLGILGNDPVNAAPNAVV